MLVFELHSIFAFLVTIELSIEVHSFLDGLMEPEVVSSLFINLFTLVPKH